MPSDDFQYRNIAIPKRPKKTPKLVKEPCALWQEKAGLFITWCHEQLLKNPEALQELYNRGFTDESIRKFKLGFCVNPDRKSKSKDVFREYPKWGLEPELKEDGKTYKKLWLPHGWTIPWFDWFGKILRINIRRKDWFDGDTYGKYIKIKGGMECPAIYGDQSLKVGVLLESEFDALLIQQFANDLCFCIATGGVSQPIDLATDHLIRTTALILLCPDDDSDEDDKDNAGDKLAELEDIYKNMLIWYAPNGKSPGDALKDHKVNLRQWIIQGIPPALRN